jgi:hypothetical protein
MRKRAREIAKERKREYGSPIACVIDKCIKYENLMKAQNFGDFKRKHIFEKAMNITENTLK